MSRQFIRFLFVFTVFLTVNGNVFSSDNVVIDVDSGVGNSTTYKAPPSSAHENKATFNLGITTTANTIEIDQAGSGHFRQATQNIIGNYSAENLAIIKQKGSLHQAKQDVDGTWNDVSINQNGKMNIADQAIIGDDNIDVKIIQISSGNKGYQAITGPVNIALINQKGKTGTAMQSLTGSGNDATILQQSGIKNLAYQSILGDDNEAYIKQLRGTMNLANQALAGQQLIAKTIQNGSNNKSSIAVNGQDNEVYVNQTQNANNSAIIVDELSQFVVVDHNQNGANNQGWGKGQLTKGITVQKSVLIDIDVDQIGSINKADVLVKNSHHVDVVLNQKGDRNNGSIKITNTDHYTATLNQVGIALTFQMAVNGQSGGSFSKTQN
jgi:hypothetical protein